MALVGFAEPVAGGGDYRHAYNSLAVLADGAVEARLPQEPAPQLRRLRRAALLRPGRGAGDARRAGLPDRADASARTSGRPGGPAQAAADAGAQLIANPSGSPYHRGKGRERELMFGERAREYGAHFAFCNLVGGQDELVFDGQSFLLGPDGEVLARAAQFEEELLVCELPGGEGPRAEPLGDLDEVYGALTLGLRDYVEKNGFRHVGLALSGGIDSALVALLAVDALGPERVTCVVMPSPHSSSETQEDARRIARNLGCALLESDDDAPAR